LTATTDTVNAYTILTGKSDGTPIGTVSYGTDGSGTFSVPAGEQTTAQSPHDFDNADNWSGGTVPSASDLLVFDHQAVASLKYGLDQSSNAHDITVTSGFRHGIGLPAVNTDDTQYPYDEFRDRFLAVNGGTVLIEGQAAKALRINTGSSASGITVLSSGQVEETNVPPIEVRANHSSSTVAVAGGTVGINFDGTSGQVSSITIGGTAQPNVVIGNSMTVATVAQSSGVTVNYSACTTLTVSGGTFEQIAGAVNELNVEGGIVYQTGTGTITTLYHTGGVFDCTKNSTARTITNANVYRGATIKDPLGSITWTNGIDMYCKPTEVTLDFPARRTSEMSAIA
jgi:hypothetical protein